MLTMYQDGSVPELDLSVMDPIKDPSFQYIVFHTYLTTKEVAQFLRCSEIAVRKSRNDGLLLTRDAPEHYKVGLSKILYKLSDIIEWVENCPKGKVSGSEVSHQKAA